MYWPGNTCKPALAVVHGPGHVEAVGQMANLTNLAIVEQDFHDIEADVYLRAFKEGQVIEGALGNQALLAEINGFGGTHPVLGRAGFNFHENEAVSVSKHEVNLAATRAEVGGKEFQAGLLQVAPGRPFPKRSQAQVQRGRGAQLFENGCEESHKALMARAVASSPAPAVFGAALVARLGLRHLLEEFLP